MDIQKTITSCRKGDSKAQKTLYNEYAKSMYMHCYRYVKNKEDAEDILVQGFLKIFQNLEKLEYRSDKEFEGWMKRILVNECLMFLRNKKALKYLHEEEASTVSIENTSLSNLCAEDIFRLITTLPTGLRTVFNLFVIEGYSHSEISEFLQITESTSRSQLTKARKALQELLLTEKPTR